MNYVAIELRGIRKNASASRLKEVVAETASRSGQIRLRSKLRGIYILRRVKKRVDFLKVMEYQKVYLLLPALLPVLQTSRG